MLALTIFVLSATTGLWQAFEPPIDLNQDIQNSEGHNMDNTTNNCLLSTEMKLPSQSGLKIGNLHLGADELGYEEGDNGVYRSPDSENVTKVFLSIMLLFCQ